MLGSIPDWSLLTRFLPPGMAGGHAPAHGAGQPLHRRRWNWRATAELRYVNLRRFGEIFVRDGGVASGTARE